MDWVNFRPILQVSQRTEKKDSTAACSREHRAKGTQINTCTSRKNDVKGMMRDQDGREKLSNNQGNLILAALSLPSDFKTGKQKGEGEGNSTPAIYF